MATTFEIASGDVVVNNVTGRVNMIGNVAAETDIGKAHIKCVQDLRRCLSIVRLQDGTSAGINELVGSINRGGFGSISILIKARIRSMFDAIRTRQKERPSVRPLSEKFKEITTILVTSMPDNTSYKFRVDTTTFRGETIKQSGIISP